MDDRNAPQTTTSGAKYSARRSHRRLSIHHRRPKSAVMEVARTNAIAAKTVLSAAVRVDNARTAHHRHATAVVSCNW